MATDYRAAMLPRRLLPVLLALLPAAAPAAPLVVDPAATKLAVEVRATMHSFTGVVGHPAIALEGDDATGAITGATVRFAWSDLKTGDTARDRELVAWASAKEPAGAFTLTTLSPTPHADTFTATGTLTLNGVSREIRFPAQIARTPHGWTISGAVALDHRDWGLPKIRKFGLLTVDPTVTIRFTLSAAAP